MILIVGGAGYIGSHVNKVLNARGYDTLVLDNLSTGHREFVQWGQFIEGDLADCELLDRIFMKYPIDAVMHFSAFAYVGESVDKPMKYYNNNVVNTLHLLDAMVRHGVSNFIFSSTCATYGEAAEMPIVESMCQQPINPYGRTKLMVERILADYHQAYGLNYCALRYFNAAGADPEGCVGEWHEPETHLIPLVLDAAGGQRQSISVFGTDYPTEDGSCVRDYIHVFDLADAHIRALEYIREHNCSECFNLGNGRGYSVMALIKNAEKVTGCPIRVKKSARRAGDPAILIGSAVKAERLLGWKPQYDLQAILATAWNWHEKMNHKKRDERI
jgi:UDP-glucose 4-epimerase